MIKHHPSETTLLTYATGALVVAHAQVVAVHVASCPHCVQQLQVLVAVGGALLEELPPAPLASDVLSRTMARLDGPPPVAPASIRSDTNSALQSLAMGRWRWCGPGIQMMKLARRDASGTRLDLIRVAPGVALLEHGHTGFETTAVLQGAFDDGVDHYHQGDFAEADGTLDHQPKALAGPECICLIATSGRLSPRGLLGRLVRPLLGM
ncbi:ChrR family anti-sigma-E factor [Acidisphaera sp. S103]|uniref:ChrR family anti-sigma-E factor n=1 Tax=Acidisphaera sp. S103 TaxID=1747223 RepID=UPI00131E37C1|nr:ChrR family anti-sigma-E factor [Acidisphaera sp. S103]